MGFMDHAFRLIGEIGMKHSFTVLVDLAVLSSLACHSTVLLTGIVFAGCNSRDGIMGRERLSQMLTTVLRNLSSFWVLKESTYILLVEYTYLLI